MTVFKAYMKITKKNIWMILMYLMIFMSVTILVQSSIGEQENVYRPKSVPVGVIDNDGGEAAQSLVRYIGRSNETVMLDDDRESLQEDLFYRNVDYIVRIPENFMETCIRGEEKLNVTTVPGTYAGYYVEQQIAGFIHSARSLSAAGFTEPELAASMDSREAAEVKMIDTGGNAGEAPKYSFYYRYMPYLFLSVLCYVMGYILMGFRRGSLPRRMAASPYAPRRQNMERLLASGLIAFALWGICQIVCFIMYGADLAGDGKALWYLANSLAMLLTCLTIAYFTGMFVRTANALSAIVNTLSLGMCFTCGVFVDLDMLSSGVRKAAQFLPLYWYETANDILADHGRIAGETAAQLMGSIGIQLVFAAAFVCMTLAVSAVCNKTPGQFSPRHS